MKRRDFLRTAALTGLASTIKLGDGMSLMAQKATTAKATTAKATSKATAAKCDLVAVMGGEPVEMFRKGMAELGGMSRFVKKGNKVTVKPNIGFDKTPEYSATSNPLLVGEIVKQCLQAGASEVIVFDHTCDNWKRCYTNSGIEEAVQNAGGKMMPGNEESYYKEVALPKGVRLNKTKIHTAILDSDVWINVPVLKSHGGAKMTIAMKNYMGIIWDRGFFHGNDLQQCIADVCTFHKPAVLNVVDAYRVLKSNGPQGKSLNDVANPKALFISADVVAVDTAAAKFLNQITSIPLETVKHIKNGETMKLGSMNLDKLIVKKITI